MDHFITEVLAPFQAPSPDAQLILFADDKIHSDKLDAVKHLMFCSKYAAKHNIYLVSGLLVNDNNLCLCLLNPQGKVIARQAAIHLAMSLRGTLTPADEIQVIHTELGNICLCVDADVNYAQTARAAALKGADMMITVQQLDPVEDTPERLMCSVWNAAQSNNIYVINYSCGNCTVTCPAPLTRNHDGYLVRSTPNVPTRFGLNMHRLDDIRSHFEIMENINTQLVLNYAEELGR